MKKFAIAEQVHCESSTGNSGCERHCAEVGFYM
jgi:hypothetical protein